MCARRLDREKAQGGSLDFDGGRNSQIWLQNEFLATIERLESKKERKPLGDLAKQPLVLHRRTLLQLPLNVSAIGTAQQCKNRQRCRSKPQQNRDPKNQNRRKQASSYQLGTTADLS